MSKTSKETLEAMEKLSLMAQNKSFLGREFLTWLWFLAESDEAISLELAEGEVSLEVWVDDKVVMESSNTKAHVNTLRGGDPSQSFEANAGLQTGKFVKEMKVGLRIDEDQEYKVLLNSQDLSPRSLVVPNEPQFQEGDEDDSYDVLAFRLEKTSEFTQLFDSLFRKFLDERIDESWENESLSEIRSWIKNRPHTEGFTVH